MQEISEYKLRSFQEQLGFKISDWAQKIYPVPLFNITMTYYELMFAKKDLKRMAGGKVVPLEYNTY